MKWRLLTGETLVLVGLGVLAAAPPALAADATAANTPGVQSQVQHVSFDPGSSRAIVAVRLNADKPREAGRPWICRLLHSDPNTPMDADYVRHVGAGASLVLVNLTNENVTFGFRKPIFDGGETAFTLKPDELRVLTVKKDASIPVSDSYNSDILVSGSQTCFIGLPGPKLYVP